MRRELPDILRSYASNMTGPESAPLADVLREAADDLSQKAVDATPVPLPVVISDDDGFPGFRVCVNCED